MKKKNFLGWFNFILSIPGRVYVRPVKPDRRGEVTVHCCWNPSLVDANPHQLRHSWTWNPRKKRNIVHVNRLAWFFWQKRLAEMHMTCHHFLLKELKTFMSFVGRGMVTNKIWPGQFQQFQHLSSSHVFSRFFDRSRVWLPTDWQIWEVI